MCPGIEDTFRDNPANVFAWLLGADIEDVSYEHMLEVLCILGSTVN